MKKMILFALLAVVILLTVGTVSVMAPGQEGRPRGGSRQIKVYIDKELVKDIIAIENLGVEIEAIEIPPENDNIVKAKPGYGQPRVVKFTGILTEDTRIQNWVKDVYSGKDIRKDITVECYDQAGDTVRTFNLMDTFPVHFSILNVGADGQSGTVIKWQLEVRVNRIEMA